MPSGTVGWVVARGTFFFSIFVVRNQKALLFPPPFSNFFFRVRLRLSVIVIVNVR